MQAFTIINIILGLAFLLCYAHQVFYVFYTLVKKPKTYPPSAQTNRYAILVSARNEEEVIGQLLDSIRGQDYPAELLDVFVCADNCTDGTARAAREKGAIVCERFNQKLVGKGYALDELLSYIYETRGQDEYDAYFIIDADNLLDARFVSEMDKCFSASDQHRIVVGYRNTKNFGENWLASSYAMWFFHESKQLNNARTLLGVGGQVSGTGFMVHKDIFKRQGGWIHHLLIEDVEFTVDNLLRGDHVIYCHDAIIYDEQPIKFSQSWFQRLRWVKGYLQVIRHYGWRLVRGIFKKDGFSCFDLFMNIAPAYLLTTTAFLFNVVYVLVCLIFRRDLLLLAALTCVGMLLGGYMTMLFLSFFAGITERDRIHGTRSQRIKGVLGFPIFMMSFIPIAIVAIFCPKVTWKPIRHRATASVDELQGPKRS